MDKTRDELERMRDLRREVRRYGVLMALGIVILVASMMYLRNVKRNQNQGRPAVVDALGGGFMPKGN